MTQDEVCEAFLLQGAREHRDRTKPEGTRSFTVARLEGAGTRPAGMPPPGSDLLTAERRLAESLTRSAKLETELDGFKAFMKTTVAKYKKESEGYKKKLAALEKK